MRTVHTASKLIKSKPQWQNNGKPSNVWATTPQWLVTFRKCSDYNSN